MAYVANQILGASGPATGGEAVDISAADHTLTNTGLIHVGVAGNLKVTTVGGDTLTITAAPVGVYPLFVTKVFKVGTAATNMVALW